LEELGTEMAVPILGLVSAEQAAPVLEEVRDDFAVDVLEQLPRARSASILEAMAADEAADLIIWFDDDERDALFAEMDDEAATAIRSLLRYPADTAGGLMTTDFAALPMGMSAGEAIEAIRRLHEDLEDLTYVYVVDEERRLRGVISFRDLVFRRPGVGLDEAMVEDPESVRPMADREEVAELATRYNLFALPVTDQAGRLVGVVQTDAVYEVLQEEASEDFATSVGAGAEETVYTDIRVSVRQRSPWLLLNLGLALVVSIAVAGFEEILAMAPILAVLMPVVALLGGNAGAQSLAVTIRALASDDVPRTETLGILGRQAGVGLVNGVLIGAAAALVAGVFASVAGIPESPVTIGIIVGIAALANLAIATAAGSAIPLTFRALGRDPALASNIFLTLITDLVGFAGFLGVASLLL
ncbi:MAG: magnesium transporter, partial [Acidimicrobiia bacterium]|nr:magnesium transporter [Acidimicrobiia bacterium]